MRRIWAMLLLAVFGFSLAAPVLLASDPDSNLPPCCRRNGKHHCAMMDSRPASPASGPSLRTDRCALFPHAQAVPAGPIVSLPVAAPAIYAGLLGHAAICPQTAALCRSSYSRAGQKRGPPTPLS